MVRAAGFAAGVILASVSTACLRVGSNPGPHRPRAPAYMTKDDVLSVNGRTLSLSGYVAMRGELSHLPREAFLWVATAALAVQNELLLKGGFSPDPRGAVAIARYAIQDVVPAAAEPTLRSFWGTGSLPAPQELRVHLDRLVTRSILQRNALILAELH